MLSGKRLACHRSDGVRKAIEADLGKFKNKLAKQRDAVQKLVDSQDFKERFWGGWWFGVILFVHVSDPGKIEY